MPFVSNSFLALFLTNRKENGLCHLNVISLIRGIASLPLCSPVILKLFYGATRWQLGQMVLGSLLHVLGEGQMVSNGEVSPGNIKVRGHLGVPGPGLCFHKQYLAQSLQQHLLNITIKQMEIKKRR